MIKNTAKLLKSYYAYFIMGVWSLVPLLWFKPGHIIAGGEQGTYYDPSKVLDNWEYLWDSLARGGGVTLEIVRVFPYGLFWQLGKWLGFGLPTIEKLWFILIVFLASYGAYKLAKTFIKQNSIALVVSFFYTFNIAVSAVGVLNPSLNVIHSSLPLLLYFFMQYLDRGKNKDLIILGLLTVWSTQSWVNTPASLPIFIVPGLYVIFRIVFEKVNIKKDLLRFGKYLGIFSLFNIWWLIPYTIFIGFSSNFETINSRAGSLFRTTAVYDVLRSLGKWAFNYDYLIKVGAPSEFAPLFYDNWVVVTGTFLLSFLVFSFLVVKPFRKFNSKEYFFMFLALVGMLFVKGSLKPFGFLYLFAFEHVPGFFMFREPYTKFIPLLILAFPMLLGISLQNLLELVNKKFKKHIIFFLAVVFVGIQAFPFFFSGLNLRKNVGPVKSYHVKIPNYWKDALSHIKSIEPGKLLAFPPNILPRYNWETGASFRGGFANYVPGFEALFPEAGAVQFLSKNTFYDLFFERSISLARSLALLNVKYVLHERDVDWRWEGGQPPSSVDESLRATGTLIKLNDFGEFTPSFLDKVAGTIPDRWPLKFPYIYADKVNIKKELYTDLEGTPALILYEVKPEFFLPVIYSPDKVVFAHGGVEALLDISSFDDYLPKIGFYMNSDKNSFGIWHDLFEEDEKTYIKDRGQFFVVGERIYPFFSEEKYTWIDGWAWPEVSVDPQSLLSRAVRLKELVITLFEKKPLDRADLMFWLASKRAAELEEFVLDSDSKHFLIKSYTSLAQNAVDEIKNIPVTERKESYWGMVIKSIMYMRRANEIFEENLDSFSEVSETTAVYENYMQWIENVASPDCTRFCYDLWVQESGDYELFVSKRDMDKLVLLGTSIEEIQVTVYWLDKYGVKRDYQELSGFTAQYGDNWYKLVDVSLNGNTVYRVNLFSEGDATNLLIGEWQTNLEEYQKTNELRLVSQSLSVALGRNLYSKRIQETIEGEPENIYLYVDSVRFKEISNWDPAEKYILSFDYVRRAGSLGIAVIENIKTNSDNVPEHPIQRAIYDDVLKDARFSEKCLEDKCIGHYEKVISSSRDAVGASLYFYLFPEGNRFSDVELSNVSVKRLANPKVMMRRFGDSEHFLATPKIEFEKINPTEYLIRVKSSKDPYFLIFNESYHNGWKLYYNQEEIAANTHQMVNLFSNSWFVSPDDTGGIGDYTLLLKFVPQAFYNYGKIISALTISVGILYVAIVQVKELYANDKKKKK